ncbi:hypothetical protein [Conexibacter sp. W3-3-2]|uniref:hypothetical protein n=1 Tax=Conexibacter sp. W3-3-2 TaxID=2675227 RepID=UPI0018ABDBAB|nr:hypothetical protein [Conexibacter sp. W3-3-2]
MTDSAVSPDPYPLRRSFLEQGLGSAVGLVQFNAQELVDKVSASTLAGAVVSSANAPIGTLEFDALTVMALDFAEDGDDTTYELRFQLGALLRKLGITPGDTSAETSSSRSSASTTSRSNCPSSTRTATRSASASDACSANSPSTPTPARCRKSTGPATRPATSASSRSPTPRAPTPRSP